MSIDIEPATAADVPAVRTVLARALVDDPMLVWMFPADDPLRLTRTALYFAAQVERLVHHGVAFVARDTSDGHQRVVGAALWHQPDCPRIDAVPTGADAAAVVLGAERADDLAAQFDAYGASAPPCEGPYLAKLGVLAEYRGRRIGERLLDASHGHFGSSHAGATWLESTHERNHAFYARCGYRIVHRAPFAGTLLTRMVRTT